jgi:glycosyltransferase involved in cell wall biosynthesis
MKLSIVISNRNDVSMLVVTIRSCIEELRYLGLRNCEIIVCDNSDQEVYNRLSSAIPTGYIKDGLLKVFHQDFPCLFTARETAIENSTGEYIACVDSHVIIGKDMFCELVLFMESRQDDETLGFAHAPVNWAHQHERASKHDRDMSVNELGSWGTAYEKIRTITWKGMPWICRREWFLDKEKGLGGYGALAEHKLSWGGGDMHIGIKPWLLGFKNWAVPTNPCIHIGPFPKIDIGKNSNVTKVGEDKYRLYARSGNGPHTVGFLVSCYILGGEPMMRRNRSAIEERFGRFIDVGKWWDKAKEYGEHEKQWLDKRKIMSFERLLETKPWESS